MKFTAFQRFLFSGQMWIPMVDTSTEDLVLTYQKDVFFDFTADPSTPRQVIVSPEPFPTTTVLTGVTDRYGRFPMPLAEWTITSVEPLTNPMRETELYRHQAALSKVSDFGYPISRPNA